MKYLWIYAAAVNLISFVLFGIDKHKAVHHEWRIRESVLMLSAVLGGSAGAWIGMKVFHHKTRRPLFAAGVPLILILDILVLVLYFKSHNLTYF